MLRKRLINLTVAVASFGALAFASPAVLANGNDNEHNKITICHRTGSNSNPYVVITPNANGVVSGHAGHTGPIFPSTGSDGKWGDIIPPFDYNDHGTTKHFPGQNWTAQGQAILNNGCKVGGQGGGNETPPPTNGGGGQGGGVTLGTNTNQSTAAANGGQGGVAATPAGGVNAGFGSASTVSASAAVGLIVSLASVALGVRRLDKSEV